VAIFKHRKQLVFFSLLLLVFLSVPLCIYLGYYKASIFEITRVIFRPDNSQLSIVVWDLRIKRILAAIIIGAILGGSGTAVQASMRNPLASPFTLGLSYAASVGVAVGLLALNEGSILRYQINIQNPFIIAFFAFIFSLIQVLIILLLAYKAGLSSISLVLSSIAISFAYQALLYLIQYFFLNEIYVSTVVFWTFGDLERISWEELKLIAIVSLLIVIPYFVYRSIDYDVIIGGDDIAKSSGINPRRLRFETIFIAALGASLATSFVGVVGFVCLLAPHISRFLVGGGHRYLMPTSMAMGSLILLWSDTLGRIIISPVTIPVGIMTSLLGVPLLIFLLIKGEKHGYRD
ncbi:MAG: FecCD family ABC transporter permease, partial [Fervidicoccus fontis]